MEQTPVPARIGRRTFLRVASIAGGGIFLMSCAPAAVPATPTPATGAKAGSPASTTPASTPAATAAPKVQAHIEFAAGSGGIGLAALPIVVADELFVKEEGIDEKVTGLSGGGDTVRAVVDGGFNIAHVAPSAAVIAADQGQPVRLVGNLLPFSSIFWFVKPDSPLKTMKDLKGKKLGYSRPGSVSQTYAFTVMRSLGFAQDDIQLVAAGAPEEQVTAVKTGVIDAGWANDPLLATEVAKGDIRILGASADYTTDWSESMYCTTADYAKAHGDVIAAFMRAQEKAMQFIKTNTDQAADIWAKSQGISSEVGRAALKNYPIQKFTVKMDPAALSAIGKDMVANQQVKTAPDWSKIVDQSFLPPELRSNI